MKKDEKKLSVEKTKNQGQKAYLPEGVEPATNIIQAITSAVMALVFFLLLVWMSISLLTYTWSDPAWSHASSATYTQNWGFTAGAYFADIAYYCFGLSFWWLPVVMVVLILSLTMGSDELSWIQKIVKINYSPNRHEADQYPKRKKRLLLPLDIFTLWGAVILFFISPVAEFLLYRPAMMPTPYGGGLWGAFLGEGLTSVLGQALATMCCLSLMAVGLSWLFNFSWLNAMEKIGEYALCFWRWLKRAWAFLSVQCAILWTKGKTFYRQSFKPLVAAKMAHIKQNDAMHQKIKADKNDQKLTENSIHQEVTKEQKSEELDFAQREPLFHDELLGDRPIGSKSDEG